MRIERELDAAEATIGERLHVIDLDNDGIISKEELEEVGGRRARTRGVLR